MKLLLSAGDQILEPHNNAHTLPGNVAPAAERRTGSARSSGSVDTRRALIGSVKVGALDGDLFDSFYAALRRCRDHSAGNRVSCARCTSDRNRTGTRRPYNRRRGTTHPTRRSRWFLIR
jgi:hypothetical protein